ncbi:MAG: hypothetical protein ACKVU0_20940 [Saprospiraceae bacterium]
MSLFDRIVNVYFWIKFFLSPFVIGLLLAAFLWFKYDNLYCRIGSMVCLSAGIIVGIRFAENMRKNYGYGLNPEENEVFDGYLNEEKKDPLV